MTIYGIVDPDLLRGIVDSAVVGMDVTDEMLREYIERFKAYPETSVVVVNFYQGQLAVDLCADSHVEPCIAIAYPPLCSIPTELKVAQAQYAVEELGVPHVLFTIAHSKFRQGLFDEVKEDIAAVVKAVDHRANVIVMPDFAHWTSVECVHLAEIIREAGGDLIKSTGGMGRAEQPAKIDAVVKALNGTLAVMGTSAIRNLDDVLNMLGAKPNKIAISRVGFFTTLDEIHALTEVRLTKEELGRHLAGLIWHPAMLEEEVKQYLEEAKRAGLYAVSVDPVWVPLATAVLRGSDTKLIARVDYPLGISPTSARVQSVEWVIDHGPANLEIQVPLNTSAFLSGRFDYVREDLDALIAAADGHLVSVILQTPLLSEAEIAGAALMCVACGAEYVEPIHGFGKFTPDGEIIIPADVNPQHVKLIKRIVGDKIGVKVTGGASRLIQVLVLLSKGAERVTLPDAAALLQEYDALVERVRPYQVLELA
jgi:deoxyribose-phosphate aldolase